MDNTERIDIEKYIIQQLKNCNNMDKESAHVEADKILCALLNSLGYSKIVEAFNEVEKWYE